MQLERSDIHILGEGLDHPESVCLDDQEIAYAGGEAGQLYRIEQNGEIRQITSTGGFLLGIALDGHGRIHACDYALGKVWLITPDGTVSERSRGTAEKQLTVPNYPVFDRHGNLFVSESGDYWNPSGSGCIFRIDRDNQTTLFHEGPFRFANGLAIDPSDQWLYVVQSTASNVVRIPLDHPNGPIKITHELPPGTVPDGIAFANDGRLVIGCYKPDGLYLGEPDGSVRLLAEDPTGELLSRPTNVALARGKLYVANLGGWHLSVLKSNLEPRPLHKPLLF